MQGLHRSAQQRGEDSLGGDGAASAARPAVRPPRLACQRAHLAQQRRRGPRPGLLSSANAAQEPCHKRSMQYAVAGQHARLQVGQCQVCWKQSCG